MQKDEIVDCWTQHGSYFVVLLRNRHVPSSFSLPSNYSHAHPLSGPSEQLNRVSFLSRNIKNKGKAVDIHQTHKGHGKDRTIEAPPSYVTDTFQQTGTRHDVEASTSASLIDSIADVSVILSSPDDVVVKDKPVEKDLHGNEATPSQQAEPPSITHEVLVEILRAEMQRKEAGGIEQVVPNLVTYASPKEIRAAVLGIEHLGTPTQKGPSPEVRHAIEQARLQIELDLKIIEDAREAETPVLSPSPHQVAKITDLLEAEMESLVTLKSRALWCGCRNLADISFSHAIQ